MTTPTPGMISAGHEARRYIPMVAHVEMLTFTGLVNNITRFAVPRLKLLYDGAHLHNFVKVRC